MIRKKDPIPEPEPEPVQAPAAQPQEPTTEAPAKESWDYR